MKARNPFVLLIAVLFAVAALAACDSAIEIDPDDQVPSGGIFSSANNAEAVLLGAYDGLQLTGNFGGSAYMVPDFTTTNIDFVGSFNTFNTLEQFNALSTIGTAAAIYDDPYDVINRTNEVITNANAEEIDDLSPALAGQLRAEARFIRALMYHHLVRWFALPVNPLNGADGGPGSAGVPIVLDPARDPAELQGQPRNSVGEVYSQIVDDLTQSISLFQDSGSPSGEGRATLGSSQALLARVRLYQGQYEAAAARATDVIDSGNFALAGSIVSAFGTSPTPEDVFAVTNTESDNSGTNDFPSSFYLPQELGGRGDMVVTPEIVSLYPDGDARQEEMIYQVGPGATRAFVTADSTCSNVNCWSFKFRSPNFADNIRVIRLAEMYLIRAEANARMDNEDEALADLNVIRTRAGLLPFGDGGDDSIAFDGDIVEEALLERRRELAFEGKYRHTLIRTGQPLVDEAAGVAPDFQRILPIPEVAIDANAELSQNPGY